MTQRAPPTFARARLRLGAAACAGATRATDEVTLRHVSFDPTRELYEAIDAAFARHWLAERGQRVLIHVSHGAPARRAPSVRRALIGEPRAARRGVRTRAAALQDGPGAYVDAILRPDTLASVKLTLFVAALALPANVFVLLLGNAGLFGA